MSPDLQHVEIPGLDTSGSEAVRELVEQDRHIQREKRGMLFAMLRTGKAHAAPRRSGHKPKGPTKHVRHMRRLAARSSK